MVTAYNLAWQAFYHVTMVENETVYGEGTPHLFADNIQQLMRRATGESPRHHLRLSHSRGGAAEACIKPWASFTKGVF